VAAAAGFQISFRVAVVAAEHQARVVLDPINRLLLAFALISAIRILTTPVSAMDVNSIEHFHPFRLDCHSTRTQNTGTASGFGNFFTGAAMGALGGYAFGSRNRQ
jgi:hypothetical protein